MGRQKKMGSSEFRWPFAKRRQTWIAEADRISNEAADLFSEGEFAASNRVKKLKRAASLYEHAAEFYKRAGLGLAAHYTYDSAAEVWSILGDEDSTKHCEEMADQIETFWDDEDLCEEEEEGDGDE